MDVVDGVAVPDNGPRDDFAGTVDDFHDAAEASGGEQGCPTKGIDAPIARVQLLTVVLIDISLLVSTPKNRWSRSCR